MAKHLTAVNNHVVMKLVPDEQMTKGGIVLPEGSVNAPQAAGFIISVGPDVKDPNIKEGATVYCHRNAGMDMMVDQETMKVVKDEEVYCTVSQDVEGE